MKEKERKQRETDTSNSGKRRGRMLVEKNIGKSSLKGKGNKKQKSEKSGKRRKGKEASAF